MFSEKKVLVITPARGGSKGIKRKNLHPVNGVPLVAIAGNLVKQLDWIDRAVVSTNDPEIARVAINAGLDAPFMRPEALSGDLVGDLEVLAHALLEMEKIDNVHYDLVVMLQPTCPLRKPEHVTATVKKLIDEQRDAVWTVSITDLKYHPLKQLTMDCNGNLDYYLPQGSTIIARQQLNPVYHRNGAAYAFTRRSLLTDNTVLPSRTGAIIIDECMISIDTLEDIQRIESLLKA